LPERLREQLDLKEGESLRLLHSAPRVVLFERTGCASGMAVPWDRDLMLSADVRTFSMADLLSMLHGMGKSGFLYFSHAECEKSVYLHRGEVIFASSNQKVDRLGNSLLQAGVISLAQLQEAEKRWEHAGRFGKMLVERGILSPRELWNGVKRQVEEIVRSLFAYAVGTVHFWDGEIRPDNVVRLSLPTRRLISEGLRQRDEVLKLLARLEDSQTRLVVSETGRAERSSNDRIFVEEIHSDGFFPGVCRRAGVDPLSGARMVQMLCAAGDVKLTRTDEDETGHGGHGDDAVRECVTNYLKLVAELAAPIVAVEGIDVVGERLSRVAAELAGRHPALLDGLEVGASGFAEPEQLMDRALRQPGDRAQVVANALDELIAYLEFELRNHPRIEDADVFLEAVEGLRANF